ncbi:HAMP domain-containing sensor histidine kinase [Echinimonas agarilytica]|uniref:histidine kinase n=1 Tax=Echinimonas agarilytica TaxID=1215918 RepID=A0AA42B7P4_9GAMM|nr:HAMP domain-containing sensor histidine kinase [Echinimonas agarilytica]MCM2679884.1 HAMP domain-containing histidine kinase [Echinimonas agarilytica]
MRKLISSFYSKLALAVLTCFVLIGALLLLLATQVSSEYQKEVEQKLHLELAEHLVYDNQLFQQGDLNQAAIKNAFHSMMILGPSFEFYILAPDGKVLTYSADPSKIKRQYVSLTPLKSFLSGQQTLPIIGDDPRGQSRQKIFSAAEIREDGELRGYLYIIIGGEIYDSVVSILRDSHIMTLGVWGILLTLVFSSLIVLIIFALLTRPLRRLSNDISSLQQKGFDEGIAIVSDWRQDSHDEIQKLGSAFNDMAATLNRQYQKVQSTDQLRRELVSYVSHDLRTPLSALQGYLETWQLKHEHLTPEDSEHLIQIALDNAHRTSQLVEQLFELAHLDSDNVTLNTEPVAIAELVQDVIQKLQLAAIEKQVSLTVSPEDPSLMANADIQRIERVFTNLIDNAIRHCQSGDSITVHIDARDNHGKLGIRVTDTGCGIPEDEIGQIFEPHFRASNSSDNGRVHSGLGLAITERILALHNSLIEVSSKPTQGTEFRFQLASV